MTRESFNSSREGSAPLDDRRSSPDRSSRGSRRWKSLTVRGLAIGLGLAAAAWGTPKIAPYFYNPDGDLSIQTGCFNLDSATNTHEYLGGKISVQLVVKHPNRIQPPKYFAVVTNQDNHDPELIRLESGQISAAVTDESGKIISWNGPRTQVNVEPPSLHQIDLYTVSLTDIPNSITPLNLVADKTLTSEDSCS